MLRKSYLLGFRMLSNHLYPRTIRSAMLPKELAPWQAMLSESLPLPGADFIPAQLGK